MTTNGHQTPRHGTIAADAALLTVPEAARLLGIGTSTAYKWVESGQFPIPVVRIGRTVRVRRAELERFTAGELSA